MKKNIWGRHILLTSLVLLLVLPACDTSQIADRVDQAVNDINDRANEIAKGNTGSDSGSGGGGIGSGVDASGSGETEELNPGFNRFDPATYTGDYADFVLPPLLMPETDGSQVKKNESGGRSASIDTSSASKGYVFAACKADQQVRFRIIESQGGNEVFSSVNILNNQGIPEVFVLPTTDMDYTLEVRIAVPEQGENMYELFLSETIHVTLENEFAPFLVPNQVVYYTPESESVRFSRELVQHCLTDGEVMDAVYGWIMGNIIYDTQKAATIQKGYIPDPDDTLSTESGICYDYASLAAVMLRANGIPTKLVKGDVSLKEGSVYHAWNELFLKDVGWVTVEISAVPNAWNRIDLTFAASGGSGADSFIGDGNNYAPLSYY